MLGVDGSLDAHHGQVCGHAITAEDALGPDVRQTAGPRDVARGLFAGGAI